MLLTVKLDNDAACKSCHCNDTVRAGERRGIKRDLKSGSILTACVEHCSFSILSEVIAVRDLIIYFYAELLDLFIETDPAAELKHGNTAVGTVYRTVVEVKLFGSFAVDHSVFAGFVKVHNVIYEKGIERGTFYSVIVFYDRSVFMADNRSVLGKFFFGKHSAVEAKRYDRSIIGFRSIRMTDKERSSSARINVSCLRSENFSVDNKLVLVPGLMSNGKSMAAYELNTVGRLGTGIDTCIFKLNVSVTVADEQSEVIVCAVDKRRKACTGDGQIFDEIFNRVFAGVDDVKDFLGKDDLRCADGKSVCYPFGVADIFYIISFSGKIFPTAKTGVMSGSLVTGALIERLESVGNVRNRVVVSESGYRYHRTDHRKDNYKCNCFFHLLNLLISN